MLDFLFRRGNPTNTWQRSPELILTVALDVPSLNGVSLGSQLDQLSSLGRDNEFQFDTYCYLDLGLGIECAKDGTLNGFTIVLIEEDGEFEPYRGELSWNGESLNTGNLTRDDLTAVCGDWYWLDSDDEESIAFYEFANYEMQVELSLSAAVKRFVLTKDRVLADPKQRDSYQVNKPWPPDY